MLAQRALAAGSRVANRYRIVSPLARGGFGAVYRAQQIATERMVALKVLWSLTDEEPGEAQLVEARVTSRIVSDHIVQVLDAGLDPELGVVFVVMELLDGVTLAQLVRERGALPKPEAAEIVRQISVGLGRAHGNTDRRGLPTPIVHRDLKPANVFRTARDDGSMLIKILDFGMAKLLSNSAQVSGAVRGTPRYMAPEQAGGGAVTIQTDIWALGLVAFFLLTGRSYWLACSRGSATTPELFSEVLALPLEPATQRARRLGAGQALGAGFDRWFARCVNRDPCQRFASAGAAASSLLSALGLAPPESHSNGDDSTLDGSAIETQVLAAAPKHSQSFERTGVVATEDLLSQELPIRSQLQVTHQAGGAARASRALVWGVAMLSGLLFGAFLWLRVQPSAVRTDGGANVNLAPLVPQASGSQPAAPGSAWLQPGPSPEPALAIEVPGAGHSVAVGTSDQLEGDATTARQSATVSQATASQAARAPKTSKVREQPPAPVQGSEKSPVLNPVLKKEKEADTAERQRDIYDER